MITDMTLEKYIFHILKLLLHVGIEIIMYIYIYIERERERGRESQGEIKYHHDLTT